MSNDKPIHNSVLSSSVKDINIEVDSESKQKNFAKSNLSLFSKSALVFKPSNIKNLSGESSPSNQQKNLIVQKNNSNFRALSTKYGSLAFIEPKQAKKKVASIPKKEEIIENNQVNAVTQKVNITLSTIAENPTHQNIEYIFKKPLFLRWLINNGKIDQNHINSIIKNIAKDDLYSFMNTMTMEVTLYSSLSACYTISDIEKKLSKILLFKKVIIWHKPYNSNFLLSPTLKEILPLNRSIVGYCVLKQKKVITNDPAMSPGFDIDYDLPILRGAESMAIYPVFSDYGDISGVIQFIDLQSQNKKYIMSISKYERSLLKITVKLVKRQIFKDEGSSIYVPKEIIHLLLFCGSGKVTSSITAKADISPDQNKFKHSLSIDDLDRRKSYASFDTNPISSTSSKIDFSDILVAKSFNVKNSLQNSSASNFEIDDNYYYRVSFSFENVIQRITVFLKKYFDCDSVDVFEYLKSKKKFIRLCDGTEFPESSVGLSFLPIIKDEPVFVANGLHMGFPRSKLDRIFANNSALTVAYTYRYNVIAKEEDQKLNDESKSKLNSSKEKDETIKTQQNDDINETKETKQENETKQESETKETQQDSKVKQSNETEEAEQNNVTKQDSEAKETSQNNEAKQSNETEEAKQDSETKQKDLTKQNNEINETKKDNQPNEFTDELKSNKTSDLKEVFNLSNEEEEENSKSSDPSIGKSQFVFTLRSKYMLPSFLPDDLKKLNDISMILCACIHNAQINRSQNIEIEKLQRENKLIQVFGAALTSYMDRKNDKWSILRKAANDIFGASTCFVCSFDGMMIHFHPTDVTWKFDECIAGKAFNYQELTEFIPREKETNKEDKHVSFSLDDKTSKDDDNDNDDMESEDENMELYKKLGVSENLKRASAFHFYDDGKVKGSIELINPTCPEIDVAGQNIIGIICSIINPF